MSSLPSSELFDSDGRALTKRAADLHRPPGERSGPATRRVRIVDRAGPERYDTTLLVQTNFLDAKVADRSLPDYLVLVEHEHVYTAGRGVPFTPVPARTGEEPVPWVETSRGGKITYHGPGQLVVYPIFDLERHGRDVHVYLRKLEEVLSATLLRFGIEAFARPGLTGLWTTLAPDGPPKKIASIGIGVRKWIAYHGVALNVTTDLSRFSEISPCGQDGAVMTSLAEVLSVRGEPAPDIGEVKRVVTESFASGFDLQPGATPEAVPLAPRPPRPPWLKVRAPGGEQFGETYDLVRRLRLNTVCEEARCPNIGECWSHHTATFMIMGDLCTRRCSFCSVKDGTLGSLSPLDILEPHRVGVAVRELGLEHVVITSVNRDDLDDMGASHFDLTVRSIAKHAPNCRIELLIPDMRGKRKLVETILASGLVSVLNHNVETVPRLYRSVRPGAIFERSLNVLRWAKELHPPLATKSGVMVGLGETFEEVVGVMEALRAAGVEIMTIGQYLQPTPKQLPVERFVTPEEFERYREEGLRRGFSYVESGPLVRSSYHAWKHVEGSQPA